MKSVLLTGAGGYVGSVLTNRLIYRGYKVTAFDNLLYDRTSLLPCAPSQKFDFVKGDVRDEKSLKEQLNKHDIIIHLAALVGADLCNRNPVDAELVNWKSTEFISKNKSKEQILIFPNTNSGYGVTDGKTLITEEDRLTPISLYGITKCKGEEAVREAENHLVFRLATVFGVSPRMRNDLLVNNLVLKAYKDKVLTIYEGSFMRNYIHVRDVCDAVLFSLSNWEDVKNNVYNLGNDELNMSKLDLCKQIQKHLPLEIIEAQYTKDNDKRNYIVSSQKFYNKGFKCSRTLDYGIIELIKAYKMIDFNPYGNY